jgi:hypothetical protein
MIEIVAGEHVPALPFVIVDREGGHGRSHRDRGALGRKRRCHHRNTVTPADRGEYVGDEEADVERMVHGNRSQGLNGARGTDRMEPRLENGAAATGRQLCRAVNAPYDALRGRPLSSPARSALPREGEGPDLPSAFFDSLSYDLSCGGEEP